MRKFRTGVVGVGFIGAVHIEQLRRLGNVEVVAITDNTDPQAHADAMCVPRGYASYQQMIDNEHLDCVHICTPNNTHYEIAMYALAHGVNVVCEKPMTVTAAQAREMRDFAAARGLVSAMNFNCRFYPMAYQMHEMVKSGEVGEIYTIHGAYLQDWLYFDTDYSWRLEPEASGASRAFADIGSHWLDLAEFVTGCRVTAKSRSSRSPPIPAWRCAPTITPRCPSPPRTGPPCCSTWTTAPTPAATSARSLPAAKTR